MASRPATAPAPRLPETRPSYTRRPRRARRPELAILVDPRFPGGTAGAVAAEIAALASVAAIEVHALRSGLFRDREVNPTLARALAEHGLTLIEEAPVIRAEVIALHNPSCLKHDVGLAPRLSCAELFVVCHENFLRPGGAEGFDVAHCLGVIEAALACGAPRLAPISPWNRRGVEAWRRQRTNSPGADWLVAALDWFNVVDPPLTAPTTAPADRRGRHSRPGPEKFPSLADLRRQFPPTAESCAMLGADPLMMADPPRHWQLARFGAIEPARFLEGIDFFVYFTNPLWRESFGRVIAEAIAAGKVVITDPGTASAFGPAVVADPLEGRGDGVDRIIAEFIADPDGYADFVRAAQASLANFSPAAFARRFLEILASEPADAAL